MQLKLSDGRSDSEQDSAEQRVKRCVIILLSHVLLMLWVSPSIQRSPFRMDQQPGKIKMLPWRCSSEVTVPHVGIAWDSKWCPRQSHGHRTLGVSALAEEAQPRGRFRTWSCVDGCMEGYRLSSPFTLWTTYWRINTQIPQSWVLNWFLLSLFFLSSKLPQRNSPTPVK